ncbi:hypothetical protein F9L33_10635 [Amylibacter sp. SFDW26]|uniref:DUF6614 family protein n=1 Tax=Amylibacter sp. SFDW26 TaxID=2652722 RepID=UPI001261F0DF|nr:DUF6614 family protein [Amylibacter sp. SFDW26]KAB7613815.1 hypothetical protein F9L33_10635 [Amylibacter sp. SFDW26]
MAKMIGQFDLKEGETVKAYKKSFDDFCEYLKEQNLLQSWGVYERAPHDGYDTNPPHQTLMIEMGFINLKQSQSCWDYIEACESKNTEPLCMLHRSMNSKVTDTVFILYRACE